MRVSGRTPPMSPTAPQMDRTDIPVDGWIDRLAPAPSRPYLRLARLDRPIGTWLLLFPCWWGLALAGPGWPSLWFMALFGLGAVVMRGAGCTLNDLADRNFDGQVARTATRPIPSGAVSPRQALGFMVFQGLLGLVVLLQFNAFTVWLGVASLAIVAAYPFMKRFTYWPQVVLGLAFNWGALMGWAAVYGRLDAPALLLYAAGILWTLGYDTIYAHQDKEDDALIGLKSTALRLGAATPTWLVGFYGGMVLLVGAAGALLGLSWPFYLGLGAAGLHMAWQTATVRIDDPADCLAKFKSNRVVGWLLLAGIVAGRVF
ncbi:MAG: 4-hydroxybenzoate octaprenyltransferase [Rhodobacterales bacterium]|nr:4-hydroxybenzoate octaprenyltransferase [Rhodobacterales bacterium]